MSMYQDIKNGRFYLGDCLEVMKEIPDGVIDMVLCDLPYGTTACKWDSVIPFEALWEQYLRVAKENAAIVLTASQPFTSALGASKLDLLKYSWVWEKTKPTDFLQAKRKPLKGFEDVLVFYRKPPVYIPQDVVAVNKIVKNSGTKTKGRNGNRSNGDHTFHNAVTGADENDCYKQEFTNYPRGIITFAQPSKPEHPTQKPVELFEYLIKTYTNEGELVLDNTAGSGTTAIAAENTGRKWVCIEQNEEYATKAVERIQNHQPEEKPTSEVKIDSDIPVPEGEENGN